MINPSEAGLTLHQRLSKIVLFNELGDRWISRRKLIAGSKTNLMELGELKYDWLYSAYQELKTVSWSADNFNLAKDQKDHSVLPEIERKTFERVLSSLVFLESELLENYYVIGPYFSAPEATIVVSELTSQTTYHCYALSQILRNTIDKADIDSVYNSWRTQDGLRQRNKNINIRFLEFTNNQTVENFLLGLATISTIQLVLIPSELSLVYSITRRGKMTATAEILKRIQRDLDLHAQILIRIYLTILNENPALNSQELKTSIVKLMRDITNMETDFTQILSENMIPGLNNLVVAKFTQARTNKVLKEFSLEPLFPGVGGQPIPWFEGYSELKNR